jgi:iron(III) transport system substrate-binding protein
LPILLIVCLSAVGCMHRPTDEVVIYCALDREFAQPVLDAFTHQTGIRVEAKFDTESTKSVALAEQILRERGRPRCDVFWNNEILHTIRLARKGICRPTTPTQMNHYPSEFRSKENLWHPFGARARVLLVNTERVKPDQTPRRLEDLADPKWKGQVGMAKPLFGTTASHVAALAGLLGEENLATLLDRLIDNQLRVLSGNKQVAVDVGSGSLAMGLTDTDDAMGELAAERPVKIIYLDTGPGDLGTLLLPNTVSAINGSPNPKGADAFIDFLASKEGEELLNNARSAQIPLHDESLPKWEPSPKLTMPRMKVDFEQAAANWERIRSMVIRKFGGP